MNGGYLEVGRNEQGEVVVNHPDLKPDENGVGHIVFSPSQARNLASLLMHHALESEQEMRRRSEEEARRQAATIPVDRGARTMADGSPETPDHREIDPATGQQKGYVVLSEAERAKGFVRPVRLSYCHVGPMGPRFPLRDLNEEETAQHGGVGYVKFEPYPESESPAQGRYWTQKDLDAASRGACGGVTTMARALAETYARDPRFYGGTFCVHCRQHYPVDQFVWEGASERVGS